MGMATSQVLEEKQEMSLSDRMDKKFEEQIEHLNDFEKKVFKGVKKNFSKVYDVIKPFLMSIAMFWIFYRIRDRLGNESAVFTCLVIIIIFLRLILNKIEEISKK